MDRDALKRSAAEAALDYIDPEAVIGVGAGSTVAAFIRALAIAGRRPKAAVPASERTRALLDAHGVTVVGLSDDRVPLSLYVDGADEADADLRLLKGAGGALAREKVLASASDLFVCIVDETKLAAHLGTAPLPVEVLPMALYYVCHTLRGMGGMPRLREGFESDNGNLLLDVRGLDFDDPDELEDRLNAIPGVVECGLFSHRRPDVLIVGTQGGARVIRRPGHPA